MLVIRNASGEGIRHAALVGILLTLLVAGPLLPDFAVGATFVWVMISIVWILSEGRRAEMLTSVALTVIAAGLTGIAPALSGGGWAAGTSVALLLLFVVLLGQACRLILRSLLREQRVGVETILGAIGLYLLIGFAWAAVFSLVDLMGPESFAGLHGREAAEAAGVAGPLIDSRLIYFSFVSLTTLGYGDITPQTALAERLSALEAIMGQFYIAVVVAYLVSSYFAQRRAPGKPDA